MNIQIYNLSNDNKIKDIGKNLSIPSVLYYSSNGNNNNGNNTNCINNTISKKSLENIVHKFTCDSKTCCIDKDLYQKLVDNIQPSKKENIKYNRKLSRRRSKKYKSVQKSRKKDKNNTK